MANRVDQKKTTKRDDLEIQKLELEIRAMKWNVSLWSKVVKLAPLLSAVVLAFSIVVSVFIHSRQQAFETERQRQETITKIKKEFSHENPTVRVSALYALADYPKEGIPLLIKSLGRTKTVQIDNKSEKVEAIDITEAAKNSLKMIGKEAIAPLIRELRLRQVGIKNLWINDGNDPKLEEKLAIKNGMETLALLLRTYHIKRLDLSNLKSRWQVNLTGADLAGANLQKTEIWDADFSEANLTGVDFRNSELGRANLHRADLSDANLAWADLQNANLSQVNLSGANLLGTSMIWVKKFRDIKNFSKAKFAAVKNLSREDLEFAQSRGALVNTDLKGADLEGLQLQNANLWKADLSGANLRRALLLDADLEEANLSGANLERAVLKNAKLLNANLSGTNLAMAELSHVNNFRDIKNFSKANLTAVRGLSREDLQYAKDRGAIINTDLSGKDFWAHNLENAYLWKADLSGAKLRQAYLSSADLAEANLHDADLSSAKLTVADLSGADLYNAKLEGADLRVANLDRVKNFRKILIFNGANLTAVRGLSREDLQYAKDRGAFTNKDLSGINLAGIDLSGAKLKGFDLSRANLAETKLSNADLEGANLSMANLLKADLSNANLARVNLDEVYNFRAIDNFDGADLRWTKGLNTGDLEYAKVKGAIID